MGTPTKGQLIFSENGSNKGISAFPLFAIFTKSCQIREFYRFQPYETALFAYKSPCLTPNYLYDKVLDGLRLVKKAENFETFHEIFGQIREWK